MTHTLSTRLAQAMLVTLVLTAGCGGDAASDADANAADAVADAVTNRAGGDSAPLAACEMIDVAEVQALFQDEIREPSDTHRPRAVTLGECTWRAENNGRSLYLALWSPDLWDERVEFDGGQVGTVDGVGVRGVRTRDGRILVEPAHGDYFITTLVIDTDGSMNTDLAAAAAALAIE